MPAYAQNPSNLHYTPFVNTLNIDTITSTNMNNRKAAFFHTHTPMLIVDCITTMVIKLPTTAHIKTRIKISMRVSLYELAITHFHIDYLNPVIYTNMVDLFCVT